MILYYRTRARTKQAASVRHARRPTQCDLERVPGSLQRLVGLLQLAGDVLGGLLNQALLRLLALVEGGALGLALRLQRGHDGRVLPANLRGYLYIFV